MAKNVSEIEFIEKKDLKENFINQAPLWEIGGCNNSHPARIIQRLQGFVNNAD
jgi:hypothetical protein